jgi:hypothetical protein
MGIYGNFLYESSDEYLEAQILEEGATLDIFNIFKDIKKTYKHNMYEFEDALTKGDIKSAKNILKETIKELEHAGEEVKKVDDSSFSSKVGSFCFKVLSVLGSSMSSMLLGGAVGGGKAAITAKIKKKALDAGKIGQDAALGAVFAALPIVAKEIQKQVEVFQKTQYRIEKEMKESDLSKDDAAKKVGGLYKNEVLNYIESLIRDLNKLERGLR